MNLKPVAFTRPPKRGESSMYWLIRTPCLLATAALAASLACNEDIVLGPEYHTLQLEFSGTVSEVVPTSSGSPPADIEPGGPVRVLLSYVPIHADPQVTKTSWSFVHFPKTPNDFLSISIRGHVWHASLVSLSLHNDYATGRDRLEALAGRRADGVRLQFMVQDDEEPLLLLRGVSVPVGVGEIDLTSIQDGRGEVRPNTGPEFWVIKFAMEGGHSRPLRAGA